MVHWLNRGKRPPLPIHEYLCGAHGGWACEPPCESAPEMLPVHKFCSFWMCSVMVEVDVTDCSLEIVACFWHVRTILHVH